MLLKQHWRKIHFHYLSPQTALYSTVSVQLDNTRVQHTHVKKCTASENEHFSFYPSLALNRKNRVPDWTVHVSEQNAFI
jgi:hypothetical protein